MPWSKSNERIQPGISIRNRQKVEMFTWDKVATKVEKEYQTAIEQNIDARGANLQRKATDRSDVH